MLHKPEEWDELAAKTLPVNDGLVVNQLDWVADGLGSDSHASLWRWEGKNWKRICHDVPIGKID